MSFITRHLPWFVRDPAIALVGQECYTSIVEELNVTDVKCLRLGLSKGLGVGIVVGGSMMKVPQIALILNAHSARGLSSGMYILETLAYAIVLVYSYRQRFPFSTYGENVFLTLQNFFILMLMTAFRNPRRTDKTSVLFTGALSLAVTYALYLIPMNMLYVLQVCNGPLSVLSKLPQIRQNYRAKSTGQLSSIAVFSQIAGCLARIFTTATEVGDWTVMAAFLFALVFNCIIGIQMWMYWGNSAREEDIGLPPIREKAYSKEGGQVDIVVPPQSPYVTSQPGNRRWSRKVD